MDKETNISLSETARLVGVSYGRLWYALVTKRLPEPSRIGRTRVFSPTDVAIIRAYFADALPDGEHSDEPLNFYEESPHGPVSGSTP